MSGSEIISGPPLEARSRDLSGETLNELLDRAIARTPDAIALVIRRGLRDERWSYRRLAQVVERVAATLVRAGVEPGDRVLTWSQNDPWLVAAYFAVWRRGAVVVRATCGAAPGRWVRFPPARAQRPGPARLPTGPWCLSGAESIPSGAGCGPWLAA